MEVLTNKKQYDSFLISTHRVKPNYAVGSSPAASNAGRKPGVKQFHSGGYKNEENDDGSSGSGIDGDSGLGYGPGGLRWQPLFDRRLRLGEHAGNITG